MKRTFQRPLALLLTLVMLLGLLPTAALAEEKTTNLGSGWTENTGWSQNCTTVIGEQSSSSIPLTLTLADGETSFATAIQHTVSSADIKGLQSLTMKISGTDISGLSAQAVFMDTTDWTTYYQASTITAAEVTFNAADFKLSGTGAAMPIDGTFVPEFETAENSGAKVWFRELGSLKGFYVFVNGSRYIVINEDLDDITACVVCAHELGHDMLHRELSEGGIRETTLFLDNNKTEREANLFAAEILISDNEILDGIADYNNLQTISAEMCMPVELIELKIELLNFKGYDFNCSGDVSSDFLR